MKERIGVALLLALDANSQAAGGLGGDAPAPEGFFLGIRSVVEDLMGNASCLAMAALSHTPPGTFKMRPL